MGRGREEEELKAAKRGYKAAEREGNHEEEARWANLIGDILKQRGEYVEAIRWLRIDYEVSVKHLPQKQLLPTCQSLGEVYLRLDRFREALMYQKKHLELAKDSDDLIEQQRASTQLGRTYHEIFLRSETDHIAIRNAKKYFKLSMKLARKHKENPPCMKATSFLKEFIDAHNNIGMLEMDLDNLEEAEKFLLLGLKICDDEEVSENDDARSRLHHNLGSLYIELRSWSKSREHIEKDILICKRICHRQGEAKGFINLGELHYRVQKYDDAINCYQKALDIAKTLEDEDALVDQIDQNICTVKEAAKVLEALKKDEQKLKKLTRITCEARGTYNERKCLLDQNSCLDGLIDKASIIFAWPKHQEFAKRKKRVANELCDKEKLSDSFLAIGESYQKLRNFSKARKWYMKSWNIYRSIGNLEGQALVKINIGEVLDSSGDWAGALEAFEEGYRIAAQANLPSVQISALDNMHYSHMIRFDNLEEARKLQDEITNLKFLLKEDLPCNLGDDYCSETETGGNESGDFPDLSDSPNACKLATSKPHVLTGLEESDEDIPLSTLVRRKNSLKTKMCQLGSHKVTDDVSPNIGDSYKCLNKASNEHKQVGRKRAHIVVSDDEAGDIEKSRSRSHVSSDKDSASGRGKIVKPTNIDDAQDKEHSNKSKDIPAAAAPVNIEESTCSFKCRSPTFTAPNGADFGSSSDAGVVVTSKPAGSEHKSDSIFVPRCLLESQSGVGSECLKFNLGGSMIYVNISSCMDADSLNIESVKAEVACMYYLDLPEERKTKGLLPVIKSLSYCGKSLGPLEPIEDIKNLLTKDIYIEVVLDGWVPKRLMKLYLDYCKILSESTSLKLLKKLYNLEVSEDEVIVSDCGLQDISISPFLNALQEHKTVAVLDVSHNLLGNETMEKLRQIFSSSIQKYGGLTLDLHSNRLGPTALFQICDCPVISARLEVLNLSENRLTDACSSYLSTIVERCKALYSLNIEHCSITSRTVQKLAEALHDGSVLSHLSIGKNGPISGSAMINLLVKLGSLKRFSELSLTGIKLNKGTIDSICQFASSSCLTTLMLGETYIGNDGAIKLTETLIDSPEELVRLDLSYCRLTSQSFSKLCTKFAALGGISELNLGGNSIGQEGCDALRSMLVDPKCNVNSLTLDKCHLGLAGIICVVKALAENSSLEELHMAENVDMSKEKMLQNYSAVLGNSTTINQESDATEMTNAKCKVNADEQDLQVADSEDEINKDEEPTMSGPGGSCASSCRKNLYSGSEPIRELSDVISRAEHLQLLNLSRNGFMEEAIESLYSAWSLPTSRCARKHVNKDCVHFLVEGRRCCGVKPCCRRLLN